MQVKLFIEEIRKTGKLEGLSYTYWDERFTSKVRANNLISQNKDAFPKFDWCGYGYQCVESLLKPLNLQPVPYKTIVDKFAAVGILQVFDILIYAFHFFSLLDYSSYHNQFFFFFVLHYPPDQYS